MPKFNTPPPAPVPDRVTAQGGAGFSRDPKAELFLLGVTNAVGEDTFYESAGARDKRFVDLVHDVTRSDPGWVRAYGAWLRSSGLMRSASIVLAAEYVAAGGPNGRELVASVLQRADEPAEMLAYWFATHGRKLPMAVKRGIADGVRRLYTERNMLRWDGNDKTYRWGDVIDLTHPKPVAEWQSWLFKYALDRRHNRNEPRLSAPHLPTLFRDRELMRLPAESRRPALRVAIEAGWSWERLGGWLPGGMDAEAWEAVIPNMGLMALTRNLRNLDQAGVENATASHVTARFGDLEEVRRSRQFPFRFLTAWKAVASTRWALALEWAMELATYNVPEFPGRTLVLVDVSGSMQNPIFTKNKGITPGATPMRWEAAAIFGLTVARRSTDADVFLFDTASYPYDTWRDPAASLLRMAGEIANRVGGGTDTLGAIARHYTPGLHDRVVILTDEQTGAGRDPWNARPSGQWDQVQALVKVPVVSFNLAGYEVAHSPEFRNWHTIGGMSDASFSVLAALDRHGRERWPWELDAVAEEYTPPHLLPDAPVATCSRCERETVDADLFGQEDRMTQPDGGPCGGTFSNPLDG